MYTHIYYVCISLSLYLSLSLSLYIYIYIHMYSCTHLLYVYMCVNITYVMYTCIHLVASLGRKRGGRRVSSIPMPVHSYPCPRPREPVEHAPITNGCMSKLV